MRQAGEKRAEGARARAAAAAEARASVAFSPPSPHAAVAAASTRARSRAARSAPPYRAIASAARGARPASASAAEAARGEGAVRAAAPGARADPRGVEEGLVRLLVRACRVEDAREERERRHERSAERTRGGRYRAGHVEGARDARSRLWRTQPAPPPLSICWSCREKNPPDDTARASRLDSEKTLEGEAVEKESRREMIDDRAYSTVSLRGHSTLSALRLVRHEPGLSSASAHARVNPKLHFARQARKPSSSSLRFRLRPMNTILLTTFSSGPHSTLDGPKLICSCTPWNTNLVFP